jgi:uncharacterized protein
MPSIVRRVLIAALLIAAFSASPAAASTPEPPATPRDYVVDLAGVMPEEVKARLNAYLGELEQKTTAQMLVLTVQSLDGEEIRSFGLKVAEMWRLGKRGKDNGVLFVVAVRDRKYTIEVGYGLESILPDSYVGTIGREYLVPYFRKGDYGTGIYAATLAVANTIASQEGVTITGMPAVQLPRRLPEGRPFGILHAAALAIFLVVALILFITHPRQCFLLLLMSQMGGGRGGWSGGGGGGGGFGGGGGGGFGGGGASGGW